MDGRKDGEWMMDGEMSSWTEGGWRKGKREGGREDTWTEGGWMHEGQRMDGETEETGLPCAHGPPHLHPCCRSPAS